MHKNCQDIFSNYKLPFETYFYECVNHEISTHHEIEIIWVLRGKAYIELGEKTYEVLENNVFMVYMNQEHSIRSELDTIIIGFRINNEYLHRKGLFFEKIPYRPRVSSFEYLANQYHQVPLLLIQILKLLISEEKTDLIQHKIYGYFNFYVHELYNMLLKERYLDIKTLDYDDYLNRVHKIVEYIYQHFQENIKLEDLAKMTKLSIYRIAHFVKEALGVSFHQFLQNARFEHALNLIKHSEKSIVEIAKESGFSAHKYLNQMMKIKYQMTALKYRKLIHEKSDNRHFTIKNYAFINEIQACLKRLEENNRYEKIFNIESLNDFK
ncbi:MAG: AraC family transcriptional regulator [Tenericutes bacterium]|jgi:AraC-like DNA-binding protein|nr:AraC family transcriptional regulator [Mycoplasmatota bacterium]